MTKQVKVTFPNGNHMIFDEDAVGSFFSHTADIQVEALKEDLTKKEITLQNNSFGALVGAIDAEWGWSYEPVDIGEQPDDSGFEDINDYYDHNYQ